jgi:hypothetical protein
MHKPISEMTDSEFRVYMNDIMRERERERNRATGKAIGELINETPVVREIAVATVSVLSLFGL